MTNEIPTPKQYNQILEYFSAKPQTQLRKGNFIKMNKLIQNKVDTCRNQQSEYFPKNHCRPFKQTKISSSQKDYSDSSRRNGKSSTNFSTNEQFTSWGRQKVQLNKKIENLKRIIRRREKQFADREANKVVYKQIEAELIQTYRVIRFYEGKVKNLEKSIVFHENIFKDIKSQNIIPGSQKYDNQVCKLLEVFRKQNNQLQSALQQHKFEINQSTTKARAFEQKCSRLQHKIIQLLKIERQRRLNQLHSDTVVEKKVQTEHSKKKSEKQSLSINKIYLRRRRSSESASERVGSERIGLVSRSKRLNHKLLEKTTKTIENKTMANVFGNFNSKLNNFQREFEFLKKQNQRISVQLETKIAENYYLKNQIEELKRSINATKSNLINNSSVSKKQIEDPLSKVVLISKKDLIQIKNPNKQQFSGISQSNISSNETKLNFTFTQISQSTIRKLKYHLIKEDTTYSSLIELIAQNLSSHPQNLMTQLQEVPFQLNPDEIASFLQEYKKIEAFIEGNDSNFIKGNEKLTKKQIIKSILHQNIRPFKNITLRREHTIATKLGNVFKNYEAQINQIIEKTHGEMDFHSVEQFFMNICGLGEQQVTFLGLKSFEQTGQLDIVDLKLLAEYFMKC